MLNFLTTYGALAFDPSDEYMKRVLWKTVAEGRSEIVKYFLGRGCDSNAKSGTKRPYLEMAAQATDPEAAAATLDVLLHHGADINQIPDTFGNFYPEFTQLDMFRLLLERGANAHPETSPWKRSALSRSVHRNHRGLLETLLQAMWASGITLSDLEREINTLKEQMADPSTNQAIVSLDRFYWRKKYPVP